MAPAIKDTPAKQGWKIVKKVGVAIWGIFDLGTDLAMAFELLRKNEPIGHVAFLCTVLPYFTPACLAFIRFGLKTMDWNSKKDFLCNCLILVAIIISSPLMGFMGGCGLFMAYHFTRIGSPFGCVPEPDDDWIFNIRDNSGPYAPWFAQKSVGFWVACVENVPECIIAAMVISGKLGDGGVAIGVASEICTIGNFLYSVYDMYQICEKHQVPLAALISAHLLRDS